MKGYREILKYLYENDQGFKAYVDTWCFITRKTRSFAFENADVQRRGIQAYQDLCKSMHCN